MEVCINISPHVAGYHANSDNPTFTRPRRRCCGLHHISCQQRPISGLFRTNVTKATHLLRVSQSVCEMSYVSSSQDRCVLLVHILREDSRARWRHNAKNSNKQGVSPFTLLSESRLSETRLSESPSQSSDGLWHVNPFCGRIPSHARKHRFVIPNPRQFVVGSDRWGREAMNRKPYTQLMPVNCRHIARDLSLLIVEV